jgi:hypothetical protein
MSMLTPDKITGIFCIADDFCKEYAQEVKKHQTLPSHGKKICNRACDMSDSEIIIIMLCFHFGFISQVFILPFCQKLRTRRHHNISAGRGIFCSEYLKKLFP